ncbi:MAG: HAMP domain-containing protein [Actinobacteria bacterium ATB1]|nr:HAMP domain-containing protein [Actinobacteria bacterium ATB1]
MTRRLVLTYLAITAFVLVTLEVPLGIIFARNQREQLAVDIERDATVIATLAEDSLERGASVDFSRILDGYTAKTGARVVIVDGNGASVFDSQGETGRNFTSRPEFENALAGTRVSGQRYSRTLGEDLFYVAVPVASGGEVHGAVRLSIPAPEVQSRIRHTWLSLAALALVVLASVVVVGALLARSLTRPLSELEAASLALAQGDLTVRAPEDAGPPETRLLARSFNDMASRLEKLVASQRAFVTDASHQLRTPLTALRLRLENLEAAGTVDPGEYEAVLAEVERLSALVDQLLRLTSAEQERQKPEAVPVAEILRDRADVWEPSAVVQGVGLRLGSIDPATVSVVPGAAEQILDNLLDNALKVSPKGSTIEVSAVARNDTVEIHVTDEGPGMSAEERLHAFDRFWRGAPSEGGTGLGLAIVRELVQASGGEVALDERPSGGLDAVIRLHRADGRQ